jgi:hypothetical protein
MQVLPRRVSETSSTSDPHRGAVAGDCFGDANPWLLESLLSHEDRRYWRLGSFVIGLLGVATFAICTSALAGVYFAWVTDPALRSNQDLFAHWARTLAYLPLAGAYVTVLFSLHVIGSCRLPLTVRLSLVYAVLFISLAAILGNFQQPVDSLYVLCAAPFCMGGFLQRRYGRWKASSWCEPTGSNERLSIASLLDVTAAIALTFWMLSLGGHLYSAAAYICFVPAALLAAVVGMHVWARLTAISTDSSDVASGFAFWMAGNISLGCIIWLTMGLVVARPPQGLMGLVGAALVVLVAHLWTEIPVRWLRACGWTLVRG